MNIPLNIDWQQILLHLFNFAILAAGLYLLLYKPVKDFMNKRLDYYQHMSEQAQESLEKAALKEREWDVKMAVVDEEIQKKEEDARKELSQETDWMKTQTQMQCERLIAQAKENAEREREKILSETKKEAAEFAIQAVEKLLGSTSEKSLDNFLETDGECEHDGA